MDEDGREYEMHFRCGRCGMEVFFGRKEKTL
jgi:ribosomal protein L37E